MWPLSVVLPTYWWLTDVARWHPSGNRAGNEPSTGLRQSLGIFERETVTGVGFRRARCRSRGAHVTSESMCRKTRFRTCTAPIPQVAERLGVVPRPSERRCRSGPQGRGRERPPYSACLIRHGDGWDVRCHPTPAWGRSRSSNPVREGHRTRIPGLVAPARRSNRLRAGRGGLRTRRARPSGRASGCPRRPPRGGG